MHYIRCIVYKNGLFDNRILNFNDRLTIVFGRNASGKSLLARGLIDALWRKFSSRNLLGEDTWNSLYLEVLFTLADDGYYRIHNTSDNNFQIHYIHNNGEYLIFSETKLEENAADATSNIFTSTQGSRHLQNFLKKIDFETFISSSFIPSSADIATESLIDYTVLKKIILDESTGFYNHYTNIQKFLDQSSNFPGGLVPEILKYDELKRELEKKIMIIDISGSRHEKLDREKSNIQEEIDELNGSLLSLNNQKDILNKIIDNLNKVDALKNEFQYIKDEIQHEQQKIKSITDMKNEIDALFPQFSNIDINDSTSLDKLQDVFNDIRNLNERIDNFYFKKDQKKKRFNKISTAVAAAAVLSALLILIKNGFLFDKNVFLWGGILCIATLFIAGYFLCIKLSAQVKELKQLEEEKKHYKEKIKQLMEKSNFELEDYKLTEIYELLLQYFEDYINYTDRKKDIAKIKSSLKEEEYMLRIQAKLDELKKEEEQIKDEIHTSIDTLNIVGDIENETIRIEELIQNIEVEMAIIKEKIETKEKILHKIDDEFIQTSSNSDQMNALIEEKNSVDRMLKKWKINQNSLQFIAKLLSGAVQRNEKKQLKKLIDSTLDKFNHLTGNQYITKIEESLLMEMITENRIADELSPPLFHALMISMKMSLSEFIHYGDSSVPLLIDEPFQYMDDDRCSRFRDLVSYISNKRQVIIFTHHSDKRNWGNFIEL